MTIYMRRGQMIGGVFVPAGMAVYGLSAAQEALAQQGGDAVALSPSEAGAPLFLTPAQVAAGGIGAAAVTAGGAVLGANAAPLAGGGADAARYVAGRLTRADGATQIGVAALLSPSKNLFNPADPGVLIGSYITTAGQVFANAAYNLTGYIPIVGGATYATSWQHNVVFFTEALTYISGIAAVYGPSSWTAPPNAAFVRIVYTPATAATLQIELGSTQSSYQAYSAGGIPSTQLEIDTSKFLAPSGAPKINPYGRERLRQTKYRLMKRALPTPESVQISIALAGDSYTHNAARWSGPFADFMVARYGDAGGGWCGFGFGLATEVPPWTGGNQPAYKQGNARPSSYPTTHYGATTSTYAVGPSPDLAVASLTGATCYVTQGFPASPTHTGCTLVFVGTADGVIKYSWDGGATWSAAVNVQGTLNAVQTVALTGIPAGAGTLTVQWVAGTAKLCGVLLTSAAPGVYVHKIGATGSSISSWASATATQWEAGIAALAPQLIVYMDGPNSQAGNMTASAWATNLSTLVGRFRTAAPGSDILLMAPPENQLGRTVKISDYALELRRFALSNNVCVLDLQDHFGSATSPSEYGSAGAVPLFNVDNLHPEPSTGGRVILSAVLSTISPA